MRAIAVATAALLIGGTLSAVVAVPAQAQTAAAAGTFVPVAQQRMVDTSLAAGKTDSFAIAGHGPIPSSGASAITATITVTSPTASGGITAWGAGGAPGTTNLQFGKGQAVSDHAVIALSDGAIQLKDTQGSGTVRVIVDVAGYYVSGTVSERPGVFHAVPPTRAVDTRTAHNTTQGPVPGGKTIVGALAGTAGIPSSGVGAVAVTITAVGPTKAGSLTAFATATPRPVEAALYFAAGKGTSNFAVVPVDNLSRLDVYDASAGSVNVVVDVVGYYPAGAPLDAGAYQPTPPSRVYTLSSFAAHKTVAVKVAGMGGVPLAAGSSVLMTVIVVKPTRAGGITAWPSATTRPGVTELQWAAGQEIADQVLVQVGSNGYVDLYNASSGSEQVVVDIHGYAAPTTITPPMTSVARYADDLGSVSGHDTSADAQIMDDHGQADAAGGRRFALLDLGAQSISPPLSSTDPGVALALSDNVHLSYTDLAPILEAYLDGYAAGAPGTAATIAVGTNNDGDFDTNSSTYYAPAARGADWAALVKQLKDYASANDPKLTVVGADDIEAAFASTEAQAQQWEAAYLSEPAATLIYNGDANDCPTTFDTTGTECAYGWTQAQYYALAHHGSQVQVLPQIFNVGEATKWANIDATGGSGLEFVGALTESARDSGTLSADAGWAALYRALSSITATPKLANSVALVAG